MTHSNTNPRSGQYLMHAHSHITREVSAMDSCFSLIRPHSHGIAFGQKIGLNVLCVLPFTAEADAKGRMHKACSPIFCPKAMPYWWGQTRPKQLSMATTGLVIWLCECVRYWLDRGDTPSYGRYMRPQREWFFRAVLVVNEVSILANFVHFGHK